MRKCRLINLDRELDYWLGLSLQNKAVNQIKTFDDIDWLMLLRHKPVITLGYFAKEKDILVAEEFLKEEGVEVYRTDRGGRVTYHGPGQLIGYPIIELRRKGLRSYTPKLCRTLIDLLKDYGIEAERKDGKLLGIWVGNKKIAAIGYSIKKSRHKERVKAITKHGFALYVSKDDMENFKYIVPCEMPDIKLTSMEEILGKEVDFNELKEKYVKHFERVFKYETLEET